MNPTTAPEEDERDAEIARLKEQVAALEAENASLKRATASKSDERSSIMSALFESIPLGLGVFRPDGLLLAANPEAERQMGISREVTVRSYNTLADPQAVAVGMAIIFEKVMQGETVERCYSYDSTPYASEVLKGQVAWYETTYFPIVKEDGTITHVGTITQNVTEDVNRKRALTEAQAHVTNAQRELAAQRATITALSSPVIQVWEGILTVPLVGAIDERRASKVTQDLLEAVVRHRAEIVILDITGVEAIDAQTASYLLATVRAAGLLGCQAALVGMRPEIAQTIVRMGVDLTGIATRANLMAGITWAFERRGLRVA